MHEKDHVGATLAAKCEPAGIDCMTSLITRAHNAVGGSPSLC